MFVVWVDAYQIKVLKRDLMIMYEAATTGISTARIINQKNASSSMWAFSESLEALFLVDLCYLLWPICFNVVGSCPDYGLPPKRLREVIAQILSARAGVQAFRYRCQTIIFDIHPTSIYEV